MTNLKYVAEAILGMHSMSMMQQRETIIDEYGIKPNTQALENCDHQMNRAERRRAARE